MTEDDLDHSERDEDHCASHRVSFGGGFAEEKEEEQVASVLIPDNLFDWRIL